MHQYLEKCTISELYSKLTKCNFKMSTLISDFIVVGLHQLKIQPLCQEKLVLSNCSVFCFPVTFINVAFDFYRGITTLLQSKENFGKIIAASETCFSVGNMVGATMGGFLYNVGGFTLPFWVTGGILLAITMTLFFLLPRSHSHADDCLDIHRYLGIASIKWN